MSENKKVYNLSDGGRITASDAKEFVRLLREGSRMDSDCTDAEYMCNFAQRYNMMKGVEVSTDTPENFMADLKKTGYIVD